MTITKQSINNSDEADGMDASQLFDGSSGGFVSVSSFAMEDAVPVMESVPLAKGISFNPVVEAKGLNGSLTHFPVASHGTCFITVPPFLFVHSLVMFLTIQLSLSRFKRILSTRNT